MNNSMKKNKYLFLIIILLSLSCTGQKKDFVSTGDYTVAISNAVKDFYKTSSLIKKDTVFSISHRILSSDIMEVSIIGNPNKFYIDGDKPLNRIPTNYIEYNGKIFYWYDDNQNNLKSDIINKLQQYRLIEYNADIIAYSRDDKKKGMNYYFCIKDLSKYKKTSSSKDIIPNISCK